MGGFMHAYPTLDFFPFESDPLRAAEGAMVRRVATVDQVWLCREAEQDTRNRERAADWAIRFKVLGPRPGD